MLAVLQELESGARKLPGGVNSNAKWIATATENAIRNCESPIEKAFAGGLLLYFLFHANMGALVMPPQTNAKEDSRRIRKGFEKRRNIEADWEQHLEDHAEDLRGVIPGMEDAHLEENPRFDNFDDYVQRLRDDRVLSDEDYDLAFKDPIVSQGILGWHAFILSPQAVFPAQAASGGDARVDMYIWCPAQPRLQMIVECDGWKYHGNEKSFTEDRKRDRKLQRLGCDIFRFSGTELYNDMQAVTLEAFQSAVGLRFGDGPEIQYRDLAR
jgi:hypothetical protein